MKQPLRFLTIMPLVVSALSCTDASPLGAAAIELQSLDTAGPAENSLEEDFSYPGADALRAQGLVLKRGDGHILFVDCADEHTLMVETSTAPTYDFCFSVQGPHAYLSLELANVYLIDSRNHALVASVLTAGSARSLPLNLNYNSAVDSNGNQSTLTELRLSP